MVVNCFAGGVALEKLSNKPRKTRNSDNAWPTIHQSKDSCRGRMPERHVKGETSDNGGCGGRGRGPRSGSRSCAIRGPRLALFYCSRPPHVGPHSCRDSMNTTPECPVPERAKPQRQAQGRLQLRRLRSAERAAIDSLTGPEPHGLQVGRFQLPVGARLLQRHSDTLVDVVGLRQASSCIRALGAYYSCTTYSLHVPSLRML